MMIKRALLILFSFIFFLPNLYAGGKRKRNTEGTASIHEVGNGGYGKICYYGSARDKSFIIYSYDLWQAFDPENDWEARDFKETSITYRQILKELLTDIAILDPVRASLYQKWVDEFEDQVDWKTEELEPTNDLGIPSKRQEDSCHSTKDVLIIKQFNSKGRKHRYEVNKYLWDLLDIGATIEWHRAALVLHEVIYREFLGFGHNNSTQVRSLVAYYFSREFQDLLKSKEINIMTKHETYFKTFQFMKVPVSFILPQGE